MEKINIKLPTTRVTPHTVVYRACGNLEMIYRLNDYSVSNHKDKNKSFKISKHYPWYTTDAMFGDVFGTYAPEFDSFIQACIWLKEHHTELL